MSSPLPRRQAIDELNLAMLNLISIQQRVSKQTVLMDDRLDGLIKDRSSRENARSANDYFFPTRRSDTLAL